MIVTILGISGLAFGSLIFEEADPIDKLDNTLLVILAVAAVAWYFMGNHRWQASTAPLVLVGLSVLAQLSAFVIEFGDSTAIGDDIGGSLVFIPTLIVALVVYRSDIARPAGAR